MLLSILRDEFIRRKARNSKYSLRSYARALKMHSSTLSAILNEKRAITPLQAQKIMRELGLNGKERKAILLKMINEKTEIASVTYKQLSDEVFSMISGWEHFALLSCLELESIGKSTKHLAAKMQLTETQTQQALERLEKFGLIRRKSDAWSATGECFTTTHEVPSEAVRRTHREYIQKALVSLDKNSVEERDVTGMTMAISSKRISHAKKLIANFRRELAEYLEADTKDEVYRLNIQLFPLSK